MAVEARQHIKRMRGGAQAHLMRASDGHYYVVKFRDNPQHPRILVNELICYVLLEHLRLPVPPWDLIEVKADLIADSPGLTIETGNTSEPVRPGLHFGSRLPVNPERQAVYDYVPLSLLRMVLNADSFLGMAAFDKWVSNADARQAIFFRGRAKPWLERLARPGRQAPSPRSLVYVANMIDHGFAFHAHHWSFSGSPERGLFARREVYETVEGFESFEPWLSRIIELPANVLDEAYRQAPPQWFDHDWDALEGLLEALYRRRGQTPELLRAAKNAARDPFPNWAAARTRV